jgi:hypothetical protein
MDSSELGHSIRKRGTEDDDQVHRTTVVCRSYGEVRDGDAELLTRDVTLV